MGESDKERWQEICGEFETLLEISELDESQTPSQAAVTIISEHRSKTRPPIINLVPHTEWRFYAFDDTWWTTRQALLLLHNRMECLSCLV